MVRLTVLHQPMYIRYVLFMTMHIDQSFHTHAGMITLDMGNPLERSVSVLLDLFLGFFLLASILRLRGPRLATL